MDAITPQEPKEAAEAAGLRYVSDARTGFRRRVNGRGVCYLNSDGKPISDPAELRRIRALAIPPAWTDVWICPSADGHIQATGRDARGRKQYRYHDRFRQVRDSTKYERIIGFARALPRIRAKVRRDMAKKGLPREKVVATVVYLLDKTLIRIGNDDYAKRNRSYGLTTLKNKHAEINGTEVRFNFVGKSGREWSVALRDRRVANIVRACQELPGQELLQYRDEEGRIQDVASGDVNGYLREITGADITAKDFRTWAGTVLAGVALREVESFDNEAQAKRNVRSAIERVAKRLGNTPTICRKCYIHPEILGAYLDGTLIKQVTARSERLLREGLRGLGPEEAAILALLRSRLKSASRKNGNRLRDQLVASVKRTRRVKERPARRRRAAFKVQQRPSAVL